VHIVPGVIPIGNLALLIKPLRSGVLVLYKMMLEGDGVYGIGQTAYFFEEPEGACGHQWSGATSTSSIRFTTLTKASR
jgi:hypothetical protein